MSEEHNELICHVGSTQPFHSMSSSWFLLYFVHGLSLSFGIFCRVSADSIDETSDFELTLSAKLTFSFRHALSKDFLKFIGLFHLFLPMVSAKLILHSRRVRRNLTLLADSFSSKYFYGFFQRPFFRSSQRVLATMSKELMFCNRHVRQNLVFTAYWNYFGSFSTFFFSRIWQVSADGVNKILYVQPTLS